MDDFKCGFNIQFVSSEILFYVWYQWLKYMKGKSQGKRCNLKNGSWRNCGLAKETFSQKANQRSVQCWAAKTVQVQTYKPIQAAGHKSTVPSEHRRTTRELIYKCFTLITLNGSKVKIQFNIKNKSFYVYHTFVIKILFPLL